MPGEKEAEKPVGGLWGKTPASLRRRQEMIEAAKGVFYEDGYQLASMDRIASVAGTTKRTLYDHFGNKEALFTASIEYGCRSFLDGLPRAKDLPEDPVEAL
jgi:TetR/AcrR family transcriptional repressor of mexJK operon